MPALSQSSTPSRQIQCGHNLFIPKPFLKCKRILTACENIFLRLNERSAMYFVLHKTWRIPCALLEEIVSAENGMSVHFTLVFYSKI